MYRDNELKCTTVRKAGLCTRVHRPLTLSISSFLSSLSCLRPFPALSPRYPSFPSLPTPKVVLQVVISFIVEAFVLNIQTTERRRVDQMSKPNDQDRDSIGEARLTQPSARGWIELWDNFLCVRCCQWTLFQWGQKWALNREITWKHTCFSVNVYMKAQ